MKASALKKLSLPLSAAILAGLLGTAHGQNPFADPAEAESPFSEPAAAGQAPSPFEPTFGQTTAPETDAPPAAADPFAAPAASAATAPVVDPFAAPTAPTAPAPGVDPSAAPVAVDPFATSPFGAPPAGTADPFGQPQQPVADPFAQAAPAQPEAGGVSPFGAAAPFGAPAAPETAQPPAADTAAQASPFGFDSAQAAAPVTEEEAGEGSISRLYQFRYLEVERVDGSRMVVRRPLTKEEAEAFDNQVMTYYTEAAANNRLPNYQPGAYDLNEWAQWMLYAYQLDLWKQYCMTTVLSGAEFEEDGAIIDWPGDPASGALPGQGQFAGNFAGDAGGKEGGAGAGGFAATGQLAQQTTQQTRERTQFVPMVDTRGQQAQPGFQPPQGGAGMYDDYGAGGGFGAQQPGTGPTVHDPNQMNDQAVAVYQQFLDTLRTVEEDQASFMEELKLFLADRESQRNAYATWRTEQVTLVQEWVREWSRRYDGQVTTVAGVRYELYRPDSVPTQTVRGANIVVTDYDLTPYDLLNPDGTVRGPAQQ